MLIQKFYSKNFLINFIISLIPVSYILGNLILNLNIIILIFIVFYFFGFEVFKKKFNTIDKFIIFFFLYVIINGTLNNFFNFDFPNPPNENFILLKSLLYTRFFLLYFALKFLIYKNIINYKIIFYSFGLCGLFVSIDIIIQYFYGKDIFGFESSGRRLSGPFNDEYIAGSFIQKFFIFLPLSILLFFKNKNNLHFYLLILSILTISFLGLIFAGNRMPLILFILVLGIFLLYQKKIQKILLISLIILSASLSYLMYTNKEFTYHYRGFYVKAFQISDYLKAKLNSDSKTDLYNTHIKEIETGILTWQQNKFFGGGIKSFYFNCTKIEKSLMDQYGGTNCNSHPHNYYLEIATALGIFGLFILITIFFIMLFMILKILHFSKGFFNEKKILVTFLALFVAEIFPFKSTGSFFTTTNATFLFILIGFIVGLLELKNMKNKI
jgi:O-antigen ligase